MIVIIADVLDVLRSDRPYRQGRATARTRAIMGEEGNPAFNQGLLKRFVNLMGLFPVGALVRLRTEEVDIVTAEHPNFSESRPLTAGEDHQGSQKQSDQRPVYDEHMGSECSWRTSARHRRGLDPEEARIDPLTYMQ